jgi:TraY domain
MSVPLDAKTRGMQALQMRLDHALKAKLEGAAARAGRSLNAEMRSRLEASFAAEEDWGGPEMLLLTRLWNARFRLGALIAGRALTSGGWPIGDVLSDPVAYRAGRLAADEVLQENTPLPSKDDPTAAHLLEDLAQRLRRGASLADTVKEMLEEAQRPLPWEEAKP